MHFNLTRIGPKTQIPSCAGFYAAPVAYVRVPVRELRALPVRQNPRLTVLDFRLTTAPGMTRARCPRTYGHGAARLGDFVLSLCVVREGGQWYFEAAINAFDEARGRRDGLELSPVMLAALYRAVQRSLIAAEGRAYVSNKGRN